MNPIRTECDMNEINPPSLKIPAMIWITHDLGVIAGLADRYPRVRLALLGATIWACFSFMTGLATGLILLTIARSGSSLGKAVIDPTHNSLIADYYPIGSRSRVAHPVSPRPCWVAAGATRRAGIPSPW